MGDTPTQWAEIVWPAAAGFAGAAWMHFHIELSVYIRGAFRGIDEVECL